MQEITKGYQQLVAEAEAKIETLGVDEAMALYGDDNVVFVDIRDIRELKREGRIPGAVHAPRGMLEFWIDPESPYYREVFGQDKKYVFFCAGGLRSALACASVQDMGMKPVCHMASGFGGWREAGGEIEQNEA